MTRRLLVCPVLLLALHVVAYGDDKAGQPPATPTNPRLEKMKKLAGTWVTVDKDGKPTDQVAAVIKVTACGSAVHQKLFPGHPHSWVSTYPLATPEL